VILIWLHSMKVGLDQVAVDEKRDAEHVGIRKDHAAPWRTWGQGKRSTRWAGIESKSLWKRSKSETGTTFITRDHMDLSRPKS